MNELCRPGQAVLRGTPREDFDLPCDMEFFEDRRFSRDSVSTTTQLLVSSTLK